MLSSLSFKVEKGGKFYRMLNFSQRGRKKIVDDDIQATTMKKAKFLSLIQSLFILSINSMKNEK